MTVALTKNALTTLAAVKAALGITSSTADDDIRRSINASSSQIEKYCNRSFYYRTVTEEPHAGYGDQYLFVNITPVVGDITTILQDGSAMDSDVYAVSNAGKGEIYRIGSTWVWATAGLGNISRDPYPGGEDPFFYKVTYNGGYVLPKDAVAASVTGSLTETFDFSGGKVLPFTTDEGDTSITFVDGDFSTPAAATAAEVKTKIDAGLGTDVECSISSGAIKLTRTADDQSNTLQVSASTGATVLGLDTDEHIGTRTLPYDLEKAAIDLSSYNYRRQGGAKAGIKSEKLLSASATYEDASTMSTHRGIPTSISSVLVPYRRKVI